MQFTPRLNLGKRIAAMAASFVLSLAWAAAAAQAARELIGPGDVVRITAFRYPDLTTETRVAHDGTLSVPLVGSVRVQGMTPQQAAQDIAARLKSGNYILNPQIDVSILEARSRQVSVLGFVTRPGRYMLEGTTAKVTDVLAMAGGLMPEASDTAVITQTSEGKSQSVNVDVSAIIRGGDVGKDIEVRSGDSVFVPKAPVVYVYGEVIRGGSYRLEPGMTVMQAISMAGGITPRGSERRIKLRHRVSDKEWTEASADLQDLVAADDVIYVRESFF